MQELLNGSGPFLIVPHRCGIRRGHHSWVVQGAPKEKWQEFQMEMNAHRRHGDKVTAENAKLRVALADGVLTEEGKKVAAMTTAALDALIGTEEVA